MFALIVIHSLYLLREICFWCKKKMQNYKYKYPVSYINFLSNSFELLCHWRFCSIHFEITNPGPSFFFLS